MMLVSLVMAWTTLELSLAAARVPVQPRARVLLAMLPWMLVSLVTKPTKVVPKVELPVPPFKTGRIPLMSEVRETWPLYKAPVADFTIPVPREDIVVDPLTERVHVRVVEAR